MRKFPTTLQKDLPRLLEISTLPLSLTNDLTVFPMIAKKVKMASVIFSSPLT